MPEQFTPTPAPWSCYRENQQIAPRRSKTNFVGAKTGMTSACLPLGEVQAAVSPSRRSNGFATPSLVELKNEMHTVRRTTSERDSVSQRNLIQCESVVIEELVQHEEADAECAWKSEITEIGERGRQLICEVKEKNTFLHVCEPVSPSTLKSVREDCQTEPPREKPTSFFSPESLRKLPYTSVDQFPATPCWDTEPLSPVFNCFAATPSDIGVIKEDVVHQSSVEFTEAAPSATGSLCERTSHLSCFSQVLATPSSCRDLFECETQLLTVQAAPFFSVGTGCAASIRVPGIPPSWCAIPSSCENEVQCVPPAILNLSDHIDTPELDAERSMLSTVLRLLDHLSPQPAQRSSHLLLCDYLSPQPSQPSYLKASHLKPRRLF